MIPITNVKMVEERDYRLYHYIQNELSICSMCYLGVTALFFTDVIPIFCIASAFFRLKFYACFRLI